MVVMVIFKKKYLNGGNVRRPSSSHGLADTADI